MGLAEIGSLFGDGIAQFRSQVDLIPAEGMGVSQDQQQQVGKAIARRVQGYALELSGLDTFEGNPYYPSKKIKERMNSSLLRYLEAKQRAVLGMNLTTEQKVQYVNWLAAMAADSIDNELGQGGISVGGHIEAAYLAGSLLEQSAKMSFNLLTHTDARYEDINLSLISDIKHEIMSGSSEKLQEQLTAFVSQPFSFPHSPAGPLPHAA